MRNDPAGRAARYAFRLLACISCLKSKRAEFRFLNRQAASLDSARYRTLRAGATHASGG
jgi:hypothetical protein